VLFLGHCWRTLRGLSIRTLQQRPRRFEFVFSGESNQESRWLSCQNREACRFGLWSFILLLKMFIVLVSIADVHSTCWRKAGPSKTGTSLHLEIDRQNASCAEHKNMPGMPPVTLTWKGDEPLDRLHISIKVCMCLKCLSSFCSVAHTLPYFARPSHKQSHFVLQHHLVILQDSLMVRTTILLLLFPMRMGSFK
jgi:hypothetical protein